MSGLLDGAAERAGGGGLGLADDIAVAGVGGAEAGDAAGPALRGTLRDGRLDSGPERVLVEVALGVLRGDAATLVTVEEVVTIHGLDDAGDRVVAVAAGEGLAGLGQLTLGGVALKQAKRHPTLGDRVTVGAGAKILGPVEIGADSSVGANAVVVKDAPADSVVVGVPGVVKPARSTKEELREAQFYIDPAIYI